MEEWHFTDGNWVNIFFFKENVIALAMTVTPVMFTSFWVFERYTHLVT